MILFPPNTFPRLPTMPFCERSGAVLCPNGVPRIIKKNPYVSILLSGMYSTKQILVG
jgi:hypothetical protein